VTKYLGFCEKRATTPKVLRNLLFEKRGLKFSDLRVVLLIIFIGIVCRMWQRLLTQLTSSFFVLVEASAWKLLNMGYVLLQVLLKLDTSNTIEEHPVAQ
jgi:hypothetical protein